MRKEVSEECHEAVLVRNTPRFLFRVLLPPPGSGAAEARPGKAVVRVELAKESPSQSLATDFEADLVKPRRE